MNEDALKLIVSNSIAAINFILLIYSMLRMDKEGYLSLRVISMGLSLLSYVVCGCWSSVIANIFTIVRDIYCLKAANKNKLAMTSIVLLGALNIFAINILTSGGAISYLPAVSFVFYSTCVFAAKNANQMKLANAVDILLWIVYDYKAMLVFCVVQDLFIIFMSLASQYVKLDKEYDDLTETAKAV